MGGGGGGRLYIQSNTLSPSEKISNVLSRHKKSYENVPNQGSMCLPISSILQYLPTHNISEVSRYTTRFI